VAVVHDKANKVQQNAMTSDEPSLIPRKKQGKTYSTGEHEKAPFRLAAWASLIKV